MLQLLDKKKKLFFYLLLLILLGTQIPKNQNNKKNFTLKVNNIEVFGLSNENNRKISENLNPLLLHNIFFIKKDYFDEILKKNNLIESFYIQKFYPNKIKVNIKKTNFLATTNKKNKKFYIGSNGKLIPIKNTENFNRKLPFVFSKNNFGDFVKLKKIIDKSDFQFREIDSFYYFPSNRWDLKTNNGLLIKLPQKNLLEALQFAHKVKLNEKIKENKIIDLRISNYMITYNE